jgi:hypothetical protein
MVKSSIEISDQEYLIKLKKNEFDLSLIKTLLKRIEFEQNLKSERANTDIEDLKSSSLNYDLVDRFDNLNDK